MNEESRKIICPECGVENYNWRSRCQTCNNLLHEEDKDIPVRYQIWDPLGTTALILGIIGTAVLTFFTWFAMAFAAGSITDPAGWLVVVGIGGYNIGSLIISRKRPHIAGIMLIVETLALFGYVISSIFITHSVFSFTVLLFLLPCLPSLASGILYVYIGRE